MDYQWDPKKAASNLSKHGIDFADAVSVLEDDWALTIKHHYREGEERFATLGMDLLGRVVVVVYTYRDDDIRIISARKATKKREKFMKEKEEFDFSKAKQGAVVQTSPGKTRITIRLDNDIINWFRNKVHEAGGGNYQTLINEALRQYIQQQDNALEKTLRKVIREELKVIAK